MANQETKFNKSAFIRSRPNMGVQEIITEAEKIGQVISPGTIWTLRSSDKRKGVKKKVVTKEKVVTPTSTKKKVAKTSTKVAFNKSAFIRKNKKLTAKEVTQKAKELGQVISQGMVYNLRSADRKGGLVPVPKKTAKKAPALKTKVTAVLPAASLSGHPSISFDPSDPVARKFIAAGLAGTT